MNRFEQPMPIGRYQVRDELGVEDLEVVDNFTILKPKTQYLYVRNPADKYLWEKYRVLSTEIKPADEDDPEIVNQSLSVIAGTETRINRRNLRTKLAGRTIVQRSSDYEPREVDIPAQSDFVENFSGQLIFADTDATFIRWRIFTLQNGKVIETRSVLREHGM